MDIREIIGNNVFKARKIRNLSQEQFAEMINIEAKLKMEKVIQASKL